MDIAVNLMEPEDGEISDSEYTPLPRPATLQPTSSSSVAMSNASRLAPPPVPSDDDDISSASEDSDDSDGPKRPKIPRPRPLVASRPAVPDKYKVWSQNLQEDALNEQLVNCDVVHKYDRSRDVESYDYNTLRPKFETERASPVEMDEVTEPEPRRVTNKRRHKDRGNVKLRLGPRVDPVPQDFSRDDDGRCPSPRFLLELRPDPDVSAEDLTLDMANKLCEEKEDLVRRAVDVLGVPRSIQLYNKTRDIEADGGMMILNGARRRTPGGVFFYLLRNEPDVTRAQHDAIFSEDHASTNANRRTSRAGRRQASVNALRAAEEERLRGQLPALLSRAEACARAAREEVAEDEEGVVEEVEEGEVEEAEQSNPPPSPATDPREQVVDPGPRTVTAYDEDDFLDVGVNNDEMEMF